MNVALFRTEAFDGLGIKNAFPLQALCPGGMREEVSISCSHRRGALSVWRVDLGRPVRHVAVPGGADLCVRISNPIILGISIDRLCCRQKPGSPLTIKVILWVNVNNKPLIPSSSLPLLLHLLSNLHGTPACVQSAHRTLGSGLLLRTTLEMNDADGQRFLQQVMVHLDPWDLLSLGRVSRGFREIVITPKATSLWKQSIQSVGMPPCPDGITEPAYVSFVFDSEYCVRRFIPPPPTLTNVFPSSSSGMR